MPLKQTITEDMKDAMRARDAARLSTIRLLLAAIKQREVDERKDMTDADVLAIIDKMLKQRKDSIAQFEAGNRKDLADAERAEVAVLSALHAGSAQRRRDRRGDRRRHRRDRRGGPAGMGKVMAELKPQARRPRRHGGRFRADQSQARGLTRPPGPAGWLQPVSEEQARRTDKRPPKCTADPCSAGRDGL